MRCLRISFPGSRHHVMNRGHRRQAIFLDEACRRKFLELLSRFPTQFRVKVHGYALMSNHFHLLLESEGDGLSRAMAMLQREFSAWLNKRRGHTGTLWGGRFLSRLIEDTRYWRHSLVYVHENPVRAGLVAHPDDAIGTSHHAYVGLAPIPEWLTTTELLDAFGSVDAYRRYIADSCAGRIAPPEGFDPHELFARITPSAHPVGTVMSRDEALATFRRVTGVDPLTLGGSRSPLSPIRWMALDWLPRGTGCSQAEVARLLGVRPEQVNVARGRLNARCAVDAAVRRLREELDATLR